MRQHKHVKDNRNANTRNPSNTAKQAAALLSERTTRTTACTVCLHRVRQHESIRCKHADTQRAGSNASNKLNCSHGTQHIVLAMDGSYLEEWLAGRSWCHPIQSDPTPAAAMEERRRRRTPVWHCRVRQSLALTLLSPAEALANPQSALGHTAMRSTQHKRTA
jgi:hypothetical protein